MDKEDIKSVLMVIGLTLFTILLFAYGFDMMSYGIHRANYEMLVFSKGNPYSYEEFQECSGGLMPNLKEYDEFFVTPTILGSGIISKEDYYIISKRKTSYWIGTPSWEKEKPSYWYCMGKRIKKEAGKNG